MGATAAPDGKVPSQAPARVDIKYSNIFIVPATN